MHNPDVRSEPLNVCTKTRLRLCLFQCKIFSGENIFGKGKYFLVFGCILKIILENNFQCSVTFCKCYFLTNFSHFLSHFLSFQTNFISQNPLSPIENPPLSTQNPPPHNKKTTKTPPPQQQQPKKKKKSEIKERKIERLRERLWVDQLL